MYPLSGALIDLDGTIFVQTVIFFVAFFVLRTFVFRPVMAVFDARESAIDGERDKARQMEKEAKEKAAKFDQEMHRVRVKATEERERLRQEGTRLERQLLEGVRRETQGKLEEAETRLDAEARRVRQEMKNMVPALAHDVASRMLDREVQR